MNAVVERKEDQMPTVGQQDSAITAIAKLAAGGASLEVIEQMKGLVEWDDARRAKAEFNAAFSKAKQKFKKAKKSGYNKHLQSHYSTLEDYDDATREALSAHGLSWRHKVATREGDITSVTCVLAHEHGHSEETDMQAPSYSMTNNAVNKLQSVGIVEEYLRRMTLKALLGLVSDSEFDNDGNGGPQQEELISEAEAANIKALMEETKLSVESFGRFFKVEKVSDLPKSKLKQAITMLEKRRNHPA